MTPSALKFTPFAHHRFIKLLNKLYSVQYSINVWVRNLESIAQTIVPLCLHSSKLAQIKLFGINAYTGCTWGFRLCNDNQLLQNLKWFYAKRINSIVSLDSNYSVCTSTALSRTIFLAKVKICRLLQYLDIFPLLEKNCNLHFVANQSGAQSTNLNG